MQDFSIGFGPKLISFEDKQGINYSLRLLPLGENDDTLLSLQQLEKRKIQCAKKITPAGRRGPVVLFRFSSRGSTQ